MGMAAVAVRSGHRRVNRGWERVFFSGMTLLMTGAVLLGFWPTYFGVGMLAAPLPSRLVHVHGAAFSLWMVLLLVQVGLISAKKVKMHRVLGMAGFGLAAAMVVLGVLAGTESLQRKIAGAVPDAQFSYIIPLSNVLFFGVAIFFAYRLRAKPDAHKRMVMIATIGLMEAAVARFPVAILHTDLWVRLGVLTGFLVLMVGYDVLTLRRVHAVTMWGSAAYLFVHAARIPLGHSAAWHWFANAVSAGGRG